MANKMPFITKSFLKNITNADGETLDILYNMAVEEHSFSPDMVNKGGVFKMATDYVFGKNKGLLDTVGQNLFWTWVWRNAGTENELIDQINEIDKMYDIYTDEGFEVLKNVINSGHLNQWNLHDLYNTKYKEEE
tara:strand:- start:972 stop:1373 length:402 start_codon:yes stop_codon:yes gene_type:complete